MKLERICNLSAYDIDYCFVKTVKKYCGVQSLQYNGIGVTSDQQSVQSDCLYDDFKITLFFFSKVNYLLIELLEPDYLCMYRYDIFKKRFSVSPDRVCQTEQL